MEGVGEMKTNAEPGDEERPRKTEVAKSREALVEDAPHSRLLYSLEDNPPWYTCLVLGIQVRKESRRLLFLFSMIFLLG